MADYRQQFIEFALARNVLRFGEFTLKSGRVSPYFFNAGNFKTGQALAELGRFYAAAIVDQKLDYDVLFGPAYKGIPLVVSVAIALATEHYIDKPYCFDRKEAKAHGEGGKIVGADLKGRVLMIDDVITAGTTFRLVVNMIKEHDAEFTGVMIALDRQEIGLVGEQSAVQELSTEFGVKIHSIIKLTDIIQYLEDHKKMPNELAKMRDYQAEYGVA
ncbi:MAG: orotate phosphoribosyltransferase [Pseudomonadota bacterium]|nr:orotate phosphoribosyltransferase [Pseudomonadota bacterium]